jgi:L-ribulose-5-phosphate 4-epimerase
VRTRFAELRQQVLDANRGLSDRGLAPFTFGNASGIDRAESAVVIKPSGVKYTEMTPDDLVVVDLDGGVIEGLRRPSSDTPTHLVLYRAFHAIGGVAHAHSHFATAWAQAGRDIPCFGTTHADHFYGRVPCIELLRESEVVGDYEANTGHAIARRYAGQDPMLTPACLLAGHAAFCWGKSAADAVETMAVLEEVARMAFDTLTLNPSAKPIPEHLLDKHFRRKHGPAAYYGQPKG